MGGDLRREIVRDRSFQEVELIHHQEHRFQMGTTGKGVCLCGLYLAEAAMLTQQAKLNVISHNLANVKTAG